RGAAAQGTACEGSWQTDERGSGQDTADFSWKPDVSPADLDARASREERLPCREPFPSPSPALLLRLLLGPRRIQPLLPDVAPRARDRGVRDEHDHRAESRPRDGRAAVLRHRRRRVRAPGLAAPDRGPRIVLAVR